MLFVGVAAGTQSASQQEQKESGKPSLGTSPAPSLRGPTSATTTDFRKLLRLRTFFVEPIDNLLGEKLAGDLAKMGRFRIVGNRNDADAVIRGTCFDLRRLKVVHSEVYINDRISGSSIWQDVVRRPYNPPALSKAVDATANEVVIHLGESILAAERR